MNVMRLILKLACVVGAFAVLAPSASSAPKLGAEVANARKGLDQAVSRGHLDPEGAVTFRASLTRAYAIWGKLSGPRARELEGVIRDVAASSTERFPGTGCSSTRLPTSRSSIPTWAPIAWTRRATSGSR